MLIESRFYEFFFGRNQKKYLDAELGEKFWFRA